MDHEKHAKVLDRTIDDKVEQLERMTERARAAEAMLRQLVIRNIVHSIGRQEIVTYLHRIDAGVFEDPIDMELFRLRAEVARLTAIAEAAEQVIHADGCATRPNKYAKLKRLVEEWRKS